MQALTMGGAVRVMPCLESAPAPCTGRLHPGTRIYLPAVCEPPEGAQKRQVHGSGVGIGSQGREAARRKLFDISLCQWASLNWVAKSALPGTIFIDCI